MYAPAYYIQKLAELGTSDSGRHELEVPASGMCNAGAVWWAVFGGRHVGCGVWQMAGSIW